jgi:hypothetical protein
MTLPAFEIPDDPDQLAPWLERHLVSLELGTLVAELAAVHPEADPGVITLRDLLGPQRSQSVLTQGLSVLQPQELRRLLTHPHLLLELQELVLFAGGSHWQRLSEECGDLVLPAERGEQRLKTYLGAWRPRPTGGDRGRLLGPRPSWYQHPLVVSLSTAAAVLFAVVVWDQVVRPSAAPVQPTAPTTVAWGWSKPGALPQDVPAADYLKTLADGANQWFKKRPDDAAGLAQRIIEFRQGCATLQLADHKPLSEADRNWLVERCQAWASKLDKHLADAEARKDVVQVRTEMDDTVNKLVTALKERAEKG